MKTTATHVLERVDDLDWSPERAREFGDEVLSLWTDYLERLPDLDVSGSASAADVKAAVTRDIPDEPLSVPQLMDALHTLAFDHTTRVGHPGFMAYISGTGTVPGAVADMLAAGLNQNVGGWRLAPGATEIELHLGRWFAQRLSLPSTAGGYVTSGGAMAAFVALKAARDARAGWPVRELGVRAGPPLTCYASDQVHDVNSRAADMLGIGRDAMRTIPSDGDRRMRPEALRAAIERDARNGCKPFAVIATAGTVSTGAIDPLEEIADLCEQHGLWLHVDGSYGGIAAMTDTLRPLFAGIERVDSIALDAHKWLYVPHSCGMILVRDMSTLGAAFAIDPSYLYEEKEASGRGIDLFSLGPQFSRGFHALKLWVSLLAHGWSAYQRRIAHDVELARYLYDRASEHPELEAMGGEPLLSIACFRFVPPELRGDASAERYLNRLNEALMMELQLGGRVFPSNAVIDGHFALRACIVNYRTEAEHVDAMIDEAVKAGRAVHARLASS